MNEPSAGENVKIIGLSLTLAEGMVLGTAVKMITIAGPVIVFGTVTSVIYGVILLLFGGS